MFTFPQLYVLVHTLSSEGPMEWTMRPVVEYWAGKDSGAAGELLATWSGTLGRLAQEQDCGVLFHINVKKKIKLHQTLVDTYILSTVFLSQPPPGHDVRQTIIDFLEANLSICVKICQFVPKRNHFTLSFELKEVSPDFFSTYDQKTTGPPAPSNYTTQPTTIQLRVLSWNMRGFIKEATAHTLSKTINAINIHILINIPLSKHQHPSFERSSTRPVPEALRFIKEVAFNKLDIEPSIRGIGSALTKDQLQTAAEELHMYFILLLSPYSRLITANQGSPQLKTNPMVRREGGLCGIERYTAGLVRKPYDRQLLFLEQLALRLCTPASISGHYYVSVLAVLT
ncbi:hypothetical protein Pelo_4532 [Pelomyxa schiedti]|nr:hypothetical protein Pelo_4532 [Pelomyxa schiedti]